VREYDVRSPTSVATEQCNHLHRAGLLALGETHHNNSDGGCPDEWRPRPCRVVQGGGCKEGEEGEWRDDVNNSFCQSPMINTGRTLLYMLQHTYATVCHGVRVQAARMQAHSTTPVLCCSCQTTTSKCTLHIVFGICEWQKRVVDKCVRKPNSGHAHRMKR
jgi:hypothetical protein